MMYHVAIQYDDAVDIMPTPGHEDVNDAVELRDRVVERYRKLEGDHGALSVFVIYKERVWV
jgi:hypothetical protein